MEKLIKLLNENSKINDWKIVSKNTKSCELFYVKNKLETNRVTNTSDIEVAIYVDKDNKRGSSTFNVYPYMDETQINEKILENIKSSLFALNEYYELPKVTNDIIRQVPSNISNRDFKDVAKDIVDAIFSVELVKEASLNATEIFIYEITNRVINSNCLDVESTSYKIDIELIPTWTTKKESVEVYSRLKYGEVDKKQISLDVKNALEDAKNRSEAIVLPYKGNINVIIEGDFEIDQIFKFFLDDLNYQSKYQHINRYNIGDFVQGNHPSGDLLNIKLVPIYEGAADSISIDKDGVVLKEVSLIEDGIVKNNHGQYRFGYYLKEVEPTGKLPIVVVKEGKHSITELKKEPYIRCVKFSGMQMENATGFFGGEVRLGFYFDGEKEIPVTGFSISGNFLKEKDSMLLSKEVMTTSNYHGPKYILFKGMKVA